MALHAVLEIGDALLQVLRADSRLFVLMATVTSIGCVIVGMAGGARDGPALAVIQREGMFAIERSRLPRGGAVTGSAVGAELPCVLDRFRVASNTSGGCALELPIDMALLALYFRVRARQREVGAVVVKVGPVPARGGMTYGAVCSELTVMFIILFMAGITIGGRALEDIVDMALIAFHFGVPALQLESGKVMVEGGFLPIG